MQASRQPRPLRRLLPSLLAAGLLAAILPSSATAGTTALTDKGGLSTATTQSTYGGLSFFGTDARNDVSISPNRAQNGDLFLNDVGGSPNNPGNQCVRVGTSQTIECPGRYPLGFNGSGEVVQEFFVKLGGGSSNRFTLIDPLPPSLPFGEVQGSSGADRVEIGSASSSGFPSGRYIVRGNNGDDRITIGDHGQANILVGGSDSDTISSFRNGRLDFVFCGSGYDRVFVDLQDLVPRDCDRVTEAPKDQHPAVEIKGRKLAVKNGRVAVGLKCPKQVTTEDCRGKLTLKRGKKGKGTLGSDSYTIKKGGSRAASVRVGGHRGTVIAIAREKGTDGRPKTTTARLKLR